MTVLGRKGRCLPVSLMPAVIFALVSLSLSYGQRPSYQHGQWLDSSACNCNGRSEKCYFDQELWQKTGRGGHCVECRDNTDGPNCEKCKENHFRRRDGRCHPCGCDRTGSLDQQCDQNGRCHCKPGVDGKKCNKCAANHFGFSSQGCSRCVCYEPGLSKESPGCSPKTGGCKCKEYVDGSRCDRCKDGYFDLEEDNEFGCVQCFCYGHSRDCQTTRGYYHYIISTGFNEDSENWEGKDYHNLDAPVYYDPDLRVLQLRSTDSHTMYFLAPVCYLGNQRASYNHYLSFDLRVIGERGGPSAADVIIEGEGGLKVSISITGQGNPMPESRTNHKYKFRLHEHPKFGWTPRLRFHDFMRILSNVTAIRIRGIYAPGGTAYLDNVQLDSARKIRTSQAVEATWIETCSCPTGYAGQSCESCAPGFTRHPPGGTSYDRCVPCSCHGHAEECDPQTGRCICKHNTVGERCERCAPGYFGEATRGTSGDCRACPCPNRGECVLLPGGEVACRECDIGHTGRACDLCVDGYFGDPKGRFGPPRPCRKCDCNDNVDPNAVGNCNSTTGECLKCIGNTEGRHCEKCKPGHYGDPLAIPKRGCKPCNCNPKGTVWHTEDAISCDPLTGQCRCRPNVIGLSCDVCLEGYWNIDSSRGCERCNCHRMGAIGDECNVNTGQCQCRPGVTGKRCDACQPYFYGLSNEGCQPCNCDRSGSLSLQCDSTGQCQCRPNMEGLKCTKCRQHKASFGTVCLDCPECYTLVEKEIDERKRRLEELSKILVIINQTSDSGDNVEDYNFRVEMNRLKVSVDELLKVARKAAGPERDLRKDLDDLKERIQEVQKKSGKISIQTEMVFPTNKYAERNITEAERLLGHLEDAIKAVTDYLNIHAKNALKDAIERSDKSGHQSERISDIAKEARRLAENHEKVAGDVTVLGKDALNISTEAYSIARDALDSHERLRGEIYALGRKLDDVEDTLRRTHELAKKANQESNVTYDKSLDVYTECNSLIIPEVHEKGIKIEAVRIIDAAGAIRKDAEDEENKLKDKIGDLNKQHGELQDLLDAATHQQQITDGLLADTDFAINRALDAIQLGEDTLEEAKETLETLQGFDKTIQESKNKADAALRRLPEIEKLIVEAEEKTEEAENALGNAEQDALAAREIAQRAQGIAEEASTKAGEVLEDADHAKVQAGNLKREGDDLSIRIRDTETEMGQRERKGRNEEDLANQVLQNTGNAKNKASDTSRQARDTLDELEDIIRELDNIEGIDSYLLDQLEQRLAKAEKEMRDSDLDARTDHLHGIREQQAKLREQYEAEIAMLENEVKNIEVIASTLPKDCYKREKLEP